MTEIRVEKRQAVLRISLARPELLNSINRSMALSLNAALDDARDESVRVVLLSADGRAFCAGQDLVEVTSGELKDWELSRIVKEHYNPVVQKICALEKPVVAAVNGVAAGAGANIALACDIVFAARSATFVQVFAKIGIIPDSGGTFFLPRLVGLARATALTMLSEKLGADDAERIGLIYRAVDDDKLTEIVDATVEKLAALPTRGLALTKQALRQSFSSTLPEQLALEERLQGEAGRSDDYREGVMAFLEKRAPKFCGR